MPYTPEQLAGLEALERRRRAGDPFTPEQSQLLDQHLATARHEQYEAKRNRPMYQQMLEVLGETPIPDILSFASPFGAGGAARVLLKSAPGKLRAPVASGVEALASGGTEAGMQELGLVGEDPEQVGVATGAPLIGQGISGLVKFGTRHAPGVEHLRQDVLAGELKAAPKQFIPTGLIPADTLYKNLDEQYGSIPIAAPKSREVAESLMKEQAAIPEKALRKQQITRLSEQTIKELDARGGVFSLKAARERLKALRHEVRTTKEDSSVHASMMVRADAAMQDLEEAAKQATDTVPKEAVEQLKLANKTWRREIAQDDLAYRIERFGVKTGDLAGLKVIKPRAILDWIDSPDSKFFRESMTESELKGLRKYLSDLPELHADFGSSRLGSWDRAMMAGALAAVGGGLGYTVGEYPGAAVGTGVAFLTAKFIDQLAHIVTSPAGRAIFKKSLGPSGLVTPEILSATSAAMASEMRGNRLRETDPYANPAPQGYRQHQQ